MRTQELSTDNNPSTPSLDIEKLENVHTSGGTTIARCPACAEDDQDNKGDHLIIYPSGQFGCINYQGDDGIEHRKRIRELAGVNSAKSNVIPFKGIQATPQKTEKQATTYPTLEQAAEACKPPNYDLTDYYLYPKDGKQFAAVARYESGKEKTFRQFHYSEEDGGWQIGGPDGLWPLYKVQTIAPDGTVFITEGEKCQKAASDIGLSTVTSAGGAKSPQKTDWSPLAGRDVVIFPDNDDAGRKYAEKVAELLSILTPPASIRIVELPDRPDDGGDIADIIHATPEADRQALRISIENTVANTPPWEPPATPVKTKTNPKDKSDMSWTGIAEKLNANMDYAYNEGLGWLRWTGTRWQQVEETAISKYILDWATKMLHKAIDVRDNTGEKMFFTVRHGCYTKVLGALRSIAYVPVETFRDIPWMLNCRNGIVDLKTGMLTPHQRNFSLNQTKATYDPNADMSEWVKVVSQIFPDPELAHYVKVLFGYGITGCVEEELFGIFFGSGKNGKSTICNIIKDVIGSYSGVIPTSELAIKKPQQDNSPHLARLVGKRIIYANEPPEGMTLNDSIIKSLASRDDISACAKYKTPFDLCPSWLLILRCNNEPQIRAVDDGIWRRVKKVPFSVTFATPDNTLDKRILQDHSSAVLRWLVEGAMIYATSGLPISKTIDTAISQYRQDQDSIQGWFSTCVIQDPKAYTELSKLSQSYVSWCCANGGYEHSQKRLSEFFNKQGFKKVEGTRYATIIGVKL